MTEQVPSRLREIPTEAAWMNPEDLVITLSDISQLQPCDRPCIRVQEQSEPQSQNVEWGFLGAGEEGKVLLFFNSSNKILLAV